jgi:hypothetical protein
MNVKKELCRTYAFSDSLLISKTRDKTICFRRDEEHLKVFGITAEKVNALEQARKNFEAIESDYQSMSVQMQSTDDKNIKAEEVRMAIRNVMGRAQLCFGLASSRYKNFSTNAISKRHDGVLILIARTVIEVGNLYMDELAAYGLNAQILTDLGTLTNELEVLCIQQKLKMARRNIMQEDRINAGNALYDTLINYCSIAQNVWESQSEAHYNDYIIYEVAKGGRLMQVVED